MENMSFFLNKESLIDLSAGWCSGAAAVICCQPVDTILTRRQAGSKLIGGLELGTAASAASTRTLIAQVGIAKLWRGALPMIGAVPFQNALLMAGYGLGKRYGQPGDASIHDNHTINDNNHNQYWGIFVGGCTGGVLQSFLMSPIELVKVQLQINLLGTPAASVAAIASATTATTTTSTTFSPMASIWKGLGATLLRDGIPHGVWFVSYEISKEYISGLLVQEQSSSDSNSNNNNNSNDGGYHKTLTVPLLSGAFAATAAWVRMFVWIAVVMCS
jgi:solute carrier family 25 carnitine/acylcarnitine transporter 20/29